MKKDPNNENNSLDNFNTDARLRRTEVVDMACLGHIIEIIETDESSIFVRESKKRFKKRKSEYKSVLEHLKAFYRACNHRGDGFGEVRSSFKQPHEPYGRLNAIKSISLATITRPVRHAISGSLYYDIDIVNCHPVVLGQYCEKNSIECDRLLELVDDRERFFDDIHKMNPGMERGDIKDLVLKMVNGGGHYQINAIRPTRALSGLYAELQKIIQAVCDLPQNKPLCIQVIQAYTKYKADTKSNRSLVKNFGGKLISRVLQDLENDMLSVMEGVLSTYNVPLETITPVHDGCMVRKDLIKKEDFRTIMDDMERAIHIRMKYKVKIIEKPMDYHTKHGFKRPDFSEKEIQDLCSIVYEKEDPDMNVQQVFSREDPFDFTNLRNDIRQTEFASLAKLQEYLLNNIPRVLFPVDKPEGWLLKTSQRQVDFVQKLPLAHVYWIEAKDNGQDHKDSVLQGFITSSYFYKHLQPIKTIIFEPDLSKEYPYQYNTFLGFEGMSSNFNKLSEVEMEEIQPFLSHIFEVLAAGNEDLYDYIVSYFAHIVQKPHIKTMIFMIFYSGRQQVGKNIILKFLAKYVLGNRYCVERTGLSEVLEEKNADFETAILCVVNEIILKDGYHTDWDRLKDLITSDRRRLRRLYCDAIEVSNYTNYIGTTNNKNSIRVEGQNDSRVCAIECSPIYRNNRKYFTALSKRFTQENGELMYRYLYNYSIERDLRDIPETELRNHMSECNKSSTERFVDDLLSIDFEEITQKRTVCRDEWIKPLRLDSRGCIPLATVYASYKEWAKSEGERKTLSKKYMTEVLESMDLIVTRKKVKHVVVQEAQDTTDYRAHKHTCVLCEYGTNRKNDMERHKTGTSHMLKYNHQ